MQSIGDFTNWLFNTRPGVFALIVGGIVVFLIISIVLERKTRKIYRNHEKSDDDWDLFDDDDSDADNDDD